MDKNVLFLGLFLILLFLSSGNHKQKGNKFVTYVEKTILKLQILNNNNKNYDFCKEWTHYNQDWFGACSLIQTD